MFGRRRDGDEEKNIVRRYSDMGEMEKTDLKIGPVKAQPECVRTYISAFDHTSA
jgi:hypothetical protein